MSRRCRHGNYICEQCVTASDAAKRFSDNVNALLTFCNPFEMRRAWLAIRLEDGGWDGTVYDTRRDAIRHQSDERLCCYFPIGNFMSGLTPNDAEIVLEAQRRAYDAGMRITDEKDPDLFLSFEQGDVFKALQKYGKLNPNRA